jgi:GntR family transcriptional regulator, transcriptional repressor for pyruvate dehydrogenase complex
MESNNKSRMVEQVYRRFETDILNRTLKPGDRLPAERELKEKLGVSRWTIREAYRILRQKGLVEIKHGGGTFVTIIDNDLAGTTINTLIRQKGVSHEHLQEFRETIESRCAIFAVERATDEEISGFKMILAQLKEKFDKEGDDIGFYSLELELHAELARMSRNPLFEWFVDTFRRNASELGSIQLSGSSNANEALLDWDDFICALEKREGVKASIIMTNHIFKYRRILNELEQAKNRKGKF